MEYLKLTESEEITLLEVLKKRFLAYPERHFELSWEVVERSLKAFPKGLWSLQQMELTGGEPDVVGNDTDGHILFVDCSAESPKGRRSYCYDRLALENRKQHKPENNAVDVASAMGIEMLDELNYKWLQNFGTFDLKTSSWLKTPESVRNLGGAIFGDRRYDRVFIYHNGAESYYAARGFRGLLRIPIF